MEPFTFHTGTALPLRRSNVDTDQIIPSDYLKRVSRIGFGEGLFAAWRADPAFPLNDPSYAGASILLAGADFGTGSSREHAVWALQEYGFRVVVSERFGDIFRNNSLVNGLLPVTLSGPVVEALMTLAERHPAARITVDLVDRLVRAPGIQEPFELDDHRRWRLMEGLDEIGFTLRYKDAVESFERGRSDLLPRTTAG